MNHIHRQFNELRQDYTTYNADCYMHYLEECKVEDVLNAFECTFVEPFGGCDFTKGFIALNSFSLKELDYMKSTMENYIHRAERGNYKNYDHLEQIQECIDIVQNKLDLVEYRPEVELMLEALYFDAADFVVESKSKTDRPKVSLRQMFHKKVDDQMKIYHAKQLEKDVKRGYYSTNPLTSINLIVAITAVILTAWSTIPSAVLVTLITLPAVIIQKVVSDCTMTTNKIMAKQLRNALDREANKVEMGIRKGKGGQHAKEYLKNLKKARDVLDSSKLTQFESTSYEDDVMSFNEKMEMVDLAINENSIKFIFSNDETVEESIQWLDNIILLTNIKKHLTNQYVSEAKGIPVDPTVSRFNILVAEAFQASVNDLKTFKSKVTEQIKKCETEREINAVEAACKRIKTKLSRQNSTASFNLGSLLGKMKDNIPFKVEDKEEAKKIVDWLNSDSYTDAIESRRKAIKGKTRKQVQQEAYYDDLEEELDNFELEFYDDEYVFEGTKSDETRKKVNKNLNKIKKGAHKVKGKTKKAGQGAKAVVHQIKKAGDAIDDGLTNSVNKVKQSYRNDMRDEIIEDKTRIKLSRIIRKAITAPVGIVAAPAIKAISAITGKAINSPKEKERRLILRELEEELEIVEEKIEDSRGDSDKEKKYQLMRIRNQLKRDIERIRFNTTSHKKGL